MNASPKVTIGLPVYNGMPHLQEALAALVGQEYRDFELVISDNASTDGTSEFCRALAARDPRVRYHRNAENQGAMHNFHAVLQRARGKYFMWAAHDDLWNPTFVSGLTAALDTAPDAVLATPSVLHVNLDGSMRNDPVDRPAAGDSGIDNLRTLAADHAIGWFYGLYRTDWLRRHYDELERYPVWGNDCLWLADVCLRYKIVGSQQALMWKRLKRSRLAPQNVRGTVMYWAYMFWYFAQISFSRGKTRREQWTALMLTWGYVYRLGIRRSNLPRTVWRVVRMLTLAGASAVWLGLMKLVRRRKAAAPATDTLAPDDSAVTVPAPSAAAPGALGTQLSPTMTAPADHVDTNKLPRAA